MNAKITKMINLMCEKEINQTQLARMSGVQPKTINDVIRGKRRPSLMTVGKIAACLGCKPSDLVEV